MPGLELEELSGTALPDGPEPVTFNHHEEVGAGSMAPNTAQKWTLVETHAPCTVDRKEAHVPQTQARIRLATACC